MIAHKEILINYIYIKIKLYLIKMIVFLVLGVMHLKIIIKQVKCNIKELNQLIIQDINTIESKVLVKIEIDL